MPGKYDHLVDRIVSGGDVSREEMVAVHNDLAAAEEADQPALWYIIELYDAYGYSKHGKSTTTDPSLELLARAKLGLPVSESEVGAVVDALDRHLWTTEVTGAIPGEAYTLLQILGRVGDSRYSPLVERFLDPQLSAQWGGQFVRLALWVLCRWWGMAAHYREQILFFMKPHDWDFSDEARLAAIGVAGEHLAQARAPELLEGLIGVVESASEDNQVSVRAAVALAEAMGHKDTYPSWPSQLDQPNNDALSMFGPALLEEAKARLRRERAN